MKIENEITGHINIHTYSILKIELCIKDKDEQVDVFVLDLVNKKVQRHLEKSTKLLLNVSTYDDYIKLIKDLGLDIPKSYIKHWTPKFGEAYFYVDSSGEICSDIIHKTGFHNADIKRAEYYNMFPTRELAEKAVNLSKLGRLILLWQYANNCLFEPDWNNSQIKWFLSDDTQDDLFIYDTSNYYLRDISYFKTEEQVKAFVKVYNKELIRLMSIK